MSPPPVNVVPGQAPVSRVAADSTSEPKQKPRWILVAAGAAVIIIGGIFAVWYIKTQNSRGTDHPFPTVGVEFTTSPLGANILIDGNPSPARVKLQEGRTYQVEARKDGYQPASQSVNVKAGSTNTVELKLLPLPLTVLIFTDLDGSAVRLDDADRGNIQAGENFSLNVDPGPHTLTIASRKSEVAIAFEAKAASLPALSAPMKTTKKFKGTAVVVTGWRNQAHVESNVSSLQVTVGDTPAQEVGSGLSLDLSGSHDLVWGEGKDERKRVLETGQAPTLTVFLDTGRKVQVAEVPARKVHAAAKPTPAPAMPTVGTNAADIDRLSNLALDALKRGNYAGSQDSAIALAKQIQKLDPDNDYAHKIIESSVERGKALAQQAVDGKDFKTAHRVTNSLDQALPSRADIAELQKQISIAEKAEQAAPSKESAPTLTFRVHHKHTVGSCVGSLTIGKGRVGYRSENGKETFDFPLSEIMKPEKALGGGFFFTAKDGKRYFFDSPPAALAALQQAMGKN